MEKQCEFCERESKYFTETTSLDYSRGYPKSSNTISFRCAYHKNTSRRNYEVVNNGFKLISQYIEVEA